MRKLLLLVFFALLHLYIFSQTDVQRDDRINQVLKDAAAHQSGYTTYGRSNAAWFINIAVLNQAAHTMSWFTCHGRLFDSTKLTDREYEQVISKELDPFELYQNICDKYLAEIAAVRDIYRLKGEIPAVDSSLFAMESVKRAKTPLQKVMAIENVRKGILTQLAYLHCANPSGVQDDPLYKVNKEQAGLMVQTKDSTVYYNIDPTSVVAKICLFKNSPEKLYIYDRQSRLKDSVSVLPERYTLLLKEKTDVFLLYRGWLELQWQSTRSAISRVAKSIDIHNAGYREDEKAIEKELYGQLYAVAAKIDQLISPEEKSIQQAVYETYKNETSEINYIPLLGIGYNLIQPRGTKEYELTNHLGNVLATVSDKKIGVSSTSNSSLIDHYEPDVINAQDYYPFGMLQPGRSYLSSNGEKYRYGFNGKENDNEVKGQGNQQDYGMRISDPRLGRFLSVDPITKDYPELTPYQFASNTPIAGSDLDGLELLPRFKQNDPFSLTTWSIAKKYDNSTLERVVTGSAHGVSGSIKGTGRFIIRDAWRADTWINAGLFLEEIAIGTPYIKVAATPRIDAAVDNFVSNVINGNAYTRSKYIAGFATDLAIGYLSGRVIGNVGGKVVSAARMRMASRFFTKAAQKIEEHLSQELFLSDAGTIRADNQVMIDRVRQIAAGRLQATETDMNFINHELTESELMKKGMKYKEAHNKSLETHGLPTDKNTEHQLYTKEALDAGNAEMEKEVMGNKGKK